MAPPAAFFWSTANLTPFAVDWPPVVHTGRSDPILIVPFDPVLPPPPPQANVTTAANVRITSPLPRTIWFSLCLLEAVADAPSHSPPSSQPSSGRECAGRRMSATFGVTEPLLRAELSTCICLEVKRCLGSTFGG